MGKKVVCILLPNNKRLELDKIAKRLGISFAEMERAAWQLQKKGKVFVETSWEEVLKKKS